MLAVGSADFTIEGWVKLNSLGAVNSTIIGNYGGPGGRGIEVLAGSSGQIFLRYSVDGTSDAAYVINPAPLALNTWTHFAAVRQVSTLVVYVNGVPSPATSIAGAVFTAATATNIGRTPDTGTGVWYLNGAIDEFRVTKGVARYTSAFTVPSGPFGGATSVPAVPSLIDGTVPARVWNWTYNRYGQVLTAKGPRTDVNDTTTYAYYPDTAFTGADPDAVGHTMGDLQTLTNAVGKVTTFTKYNKAGQVLELSDPNGVLTVNTYDARQRLTSTSVAGQLTRFGYDAVGQLKTTTLPNGAVITNTYDDAHRLTQVQDAAGNKITYTLDNSGNRIGEQVQDAGGTLARNIARSYDALNRLQSITGAPR